MARDEVEPFTLYLGTSEGLLLVELCDGSLNVLNHTIDSNVVRDISIHPENPADVFVGCGLRGWGLHHTEDGGKTIERVGFGDVWVWGVTRHPTDPETIYVGTEPPMLYVSSDNGATFEQFDAIDALDSRERWTFFHDPFHEGHIHGITFHPDRPQQIFAGVEHGALIYSRDGGESWRETLVGHDLHRIAIHPEEPDNVAAATGGGLFRSLDGGESWTPVGPLNGKYLHTVLFDPTSPERMYVYANQNENPLYASTDGGGTWSPIGDVLPAAMPADNLRLHPNDPETLVYAGDVEDKMSQLYVSTNRGETWQEIGEPLPKAWRIEVAPLITPKEIRSTSTARPNSYRS